MKDAILFLTKSKTRAAILGLFFNDTEAEYYLRQIEKITGYSAGNIRREIMKLEKNNLFISRLLGRTKLYKLNKAHPLYDEIKHIVRKTISVEGKLKDIVNEYKGVKFAFIYGSFAKAKETSASDIDLMIIGNIITKKLKYDIFEYQSVVRREINSMVYSTDEFLKRLKDKNHFVSSVINEPKIFLKGSDSDFRRFIQIRKVKKP